MATFRSLLAAAICVYGMVSPLEAHSAASDSTGANGDTLDVVLSTTIVVSGTRLKRDSTEFPFEKNRFADLLQTRGFGLIQKGVYFAQDVYADGFRRGDINIVIDGERYHNACPNRMDNPLARVNPLEMGSIVLEKTSAHDKPGLGGTVSYHRDLPDAAEHIRFGVSHGFGAVPSRDLAVSLATDRHRVSAQYAEGSDYTDGDGRDFSDAYGYDDNITYHMGEISVTGLRGDWQYRGEVMYTQDVMFPYLMMDERDVVVMSSSLSWRRHRFYLTHTSHLMNNGLRESMGLMETDARNTTLGLTGSFYEVVARFWNADNLIAMPSGRMTNHIVPDLRTFSGALWRRVSKGDLLAWGRLGLSQTVLGDKSQLSFYSPLFADAAEKRAYPTYAAGAGYRRSVIGRATAGGSVDIISEPPSPEQLFLAYRAPMGHAWWAGNPELKAPVRATVRADFATSGLRAELSGARVWNYVEQVRMSAGGRAYRSYKNVDAVLFSVALSGSWRYLDFNAAYTRGTNTGSDSALVEIAPLAIVSRIKLPVSHSAEVFVRHTYNDAQSRIDESLGETPTPSWHRFDLGAGVRLGAAVLSLEVRNLSDELYYQHLSYSRSPYTSGSRLYEPGRSVSLSILMDVGD